MNYNPVLVFMASALVAAAAVGLPMVVAGMVHLFLGVGPDWLAKVGLVGCFPIMANLAFVLGHIHAKEEG